MNVMFKECYTEWKKFFVGFRVCHQINECKLLVVRNSEKDLLDMLLKAEEDVEPEIGNKQLSNEFTFLHSGRFESFSRVAIEFDFNI
jgi:hypothetical protein